MVKKVSSIEVADLLVRNRDYMTVVEVTRLVEAKYPHLLANPGIITIQITALKLVALQGLARPLPLVQAQAVRLTPAALAHLHT